MQCNMLEAKSQFSKLVQAALAGEEVTIANKSVPVVKLVKIEARHATRKPGAWAKMGVSKAKNDWDSPKEPLNKCLPRESGDPFSLVKHGFPLSRE